MAKSCHASRRVATVASASASGADVQIGRSSSASDACTVRVELKFSCVDGKLRMRQVCSQHAVVESCCFGCDHDAAGGYPPREPRKPGHPDAHQMPSLALVCAVVCILARLRQLTKAVSGVRRPTLLDLHLGNIRCAQGTAAFTSTLTLADTLAVLAQVDDAPLSVLARYWQAVWARVQLCEHATERAHHLVGVVRSMHVIDASEPARHCRWEVSARDEVCACPIELQVRACGAPVMV
eukprot:4780759-Pleurochrysis_carterae.AAC.2